MVILDKPYISTFMQNSLAEMRIPVLDNTKEEGLLTANDLNNVSEEEFKNIARKKSPLIMYCNSENSFNWISCNLSNTDIPEKINLFKDKIKFRKLTSGIYPDFFFKEVEYGKLSEIDTAGIGKPFIIKPAVGFLSMGVYKVNNDIEWINTVEQIKSEMEKVKGMFPVEVMDSSKFIIEECIDGEEYAIDAYFDSKGDAVILNIFKHSFSSENDVSDRLYYTSKKIMKQFLRPFQEILTMMGKLGGLKNFPVHMEVRVDRNGRIVPIELNPMRFAGWCTTDIAYYAYGINVYEYYFNQKKPAWNQIMNEDDNSLYCLVVADVPRDIKSKDIKEINYDSFSGEFGNLLELRKIDFEKYPLFAFVFAKIPDDLNEMNKILHNDFRKYIVYNN